MEYQGVGPLVGAPNNKLDHSTAILLVGVVGYVCHNLDIYIYLPCLPPSPGPPAGDPDKKMSTTMFSKRAKRAKASNLPPPCSSWTGLPPLPRCVVVD